MNLDEYESKRDFQKTDEPPGDIGRSSDELVFVVQKHAASRLHYDLRLELDGVLKSWAVPKGLSLDPEVKRLAIRVEDHPIAYRDFEGSIPEGEYGAGQVIIWDRGTWQPENDPQEALNKGKLNFELAGEKLHGHWTLVRMSGEENEQNWLVIKADDDFARDSSNFSVTVEMPASVVTGLTVDQIEMKENPIRLDSSSRKKAPPISWEEAARSLGGEPLTKDLPFIKPQLATLVDQVPEGSDWLHEVKFDGYRLIANLSADRVRLFTRNRNDWTDKFPTISEALEQFAIEGTIIDGEVVVLDDEGISNFQMLQNIGDDKRSSRIFFYCFDLPVCSGMDLRQVPLVRRKELLSQIVSSADQSVIRFSQHTMGNGPVAYENACSMGLEGLISKSAQGNYLSKRTDSWQKSKCFLRQEFVVAGFTDPKGSRSNFGALVLGYFEDDQLIYAGRIGTGFSDQDLERISNKLDELVSSETHFDVPPEGDQLKGVNWIEPALVADVKFADWTDDGLVRQGSFQGLREDKNPRQVQRESPKRDRKLGQLIDEVREAMSAQGSKKQDKAPGSKYAGITLTHPDRILYSEQGITKSQLADYYEAVADRMLPHVKDRPLSLLRCPRGYEEKCFFQKNYTDSIVGPIDRVELEEESGEPATYMAVSGLPGLIQLVQLGTLEFHPWGSRIDRLERPDKLIFDLDPGPGVDWERVRQAAAHIQNLLGEQGIQTFIKTSGGKGLHVIAPLERRAGWDRVGSFAHAVAKHMAKGARDEYTASSSKDKRKGKIFVDYIRNNRGATNVAPYSTRAREGAPISTPIAWDELDDVPSGSAFTIENIQNRLQDLKSDPWEGYFKIRQSVTKSLMEAFEAA